MIDDSRTTPFSCTPSCASRYDRPPDRSVPYDSPKMNFGAFHRSLTVSQRSMPRAKASMSASVPHNAWSLVSPSGREKPAPIASTKTRSDLSSRLSGLLASVNGGPAVAAGLSVRTRTGASDPMWSHIDELPGPPL